MNHRLWDERDVQAMTSTDASREHNVLFVAYEDQKARREAAEKRAMETMDENNRLDRELDEYRQQAKTKASHDEFWNVGNIMALGAREVVKRHEEDMKAVYMIRVPCPPPQYCPSDVGFASRVPELEAKVQRQRNMLASVGRTIECKNADIAELRAELDTLRTGWANSHKAEEECERLRAQLTILHPGETVEGVVLERDSYRLEIERLRQDLQAVKAVPVKVRFTQPAGMMEFRWLEICRKYGPENDVAACPWLQDVICDFANYLATHAVIDAPAGVPSVEELMALYSDTYCHAKSSVEEARIKATTAIRDAVLVGVQPARPKGLPRLMQIEDAYYAEPDRTMEPIEFTLHYLAPYLREPTGWELDVTAREVHDTCTTRLDGYQAVLDLCRERIRPTFECQECAGHARSEQEAWSLKNQLTARINAARAALEGE